MAEKCFNFKVKIQGEAKGYVFAKNEEEARKKILDNNYDECYLINFDISTFEEIEEDTGYDKI